MCGGLTAKQWHYVFPQAGGNSTALTVTQRCSRVGRQNRRRHGGPEPVNVAGLTISGAAAGDYVLSTTADTGSGTISPATLMYVADAASSTYKRRWRDSSA